MSLFSFITDINGFFRTPPPPIHPRLLKFKVNKNNKKSPIPLFILILPVIRHLRVIWFYSISVICYSLGSLSFVFCFSNNFSNQSYRSREKHEPIWCAKKEILDTTAHWIFERFEYVANTVFINITCRN